MKKCANPRCDNKEDPRWGGFCDGCAPDPAITFIIRSAAYAQGRADERAAVVAWLRPHGPIASRLFGDAIERGAHLPKGKP